MPSLAAYATHITTPDSGIDHARKQGFELKMPDDKYKDIPPNQTGFAKAAVDRYSCTSVVVDARFECSENAN